MPQSFAQLYAHLIFSTKNRRPMLDDENVHILFDMGKMHAPVQFVERVKRESSKFVKTLGAKYKEFNVSDHIERAFPLERTHQV